MNKIVGILPAAGRGSRLGAIPCSKEIMPLGFRSHITTNNQKWRSITTIETHLQAFKVAGVEQAAVIIGGSKFDIVRYLGNGDRHGIPIAYFYQEQLRGMPFALDLPCIWMENKTVLFSMPDTLITPSNIMKELINHHNAQQADVTLGLFPTDAPHKFGMVELDDNGRIIHFIDKPAQSHLKYMWGYAAWSPRFTYFMHDYLTDLPTEGPECVLSDIFSAALQRQLKIESFIASGSHYHDIGTPESFQAAVLEMALKQVSLSNYPQKQEKAPKNNPITQKD